MNYTLSKKLADQPSKDTFLSDKLLRQVLKPIYKHLVSDL